VALMFDTPEYWQSFSISDRDLDRVEEVFLDTGVPKTLSELAEIIVQGRLQDDADRQAREANENVRLYQPRLHYEIGQRLRFGALDNAVGAVVGAREGNNPHVGHIKVIRVKMDRGGEREFVAEYSAEHPLNADVKAEATPTSQAAVAPIGDILGQRLSETAEYVAFGGLWFRKDLMPDVHVGHLNIAEALIDVAGEAQPTAALVKEVEIVQGEPAARVFALDYALAHDPDQRFTNVGTEAKPRWALRQGVTV